MVKDKALLTKLVQDWLEADNAMSKATVALAKSADKQKDDVLAIFVWWHDHSDKFYGHGTISGIVRELMED
jgi:hypothetical protein